MPTEQLLQVQTDGRLEAQRVDLRVVDTRPDGIGGGGIHHPVNHVTQVMIVHAGLCRHSRRQILHPTLDGMQFLGLQVLVGLMTANAIVELGERRHAQRRVVGGIHLPVVADAIAGIYARIDLEGHAVPRILHRHEASRQCEALQQHVMLQVERKVRAVQSVLVGAVRAVQRLAEVAADDVLVAELSPQGRPPPLPVKVAVQVDAEDIGTVMIERHLVVHASYQLEAVVRAVPVDGGLEVQLILPASCFKGLTPDVALQGRKPLQRALVLLVVLGTVERVRAEAFDRQTRISLQSDVRGRIRSLPEGLAALIVAVQRPGLGTLVAVGARVAGADRGPLPRPLPKGGETEAAGSRQIAERAALHPRLNTSLTSHISPRISLPALREGPREGSVRHHIHRPYERRRAIDASGRAFQHLDADDVAQVARQVEGVVPRLRIADVDAVQQDGYLLAAAATDADIRLGTQRTALPDVNAYGIFQQIVNTLYWRRLNILAAQYSDHSRGLSKGKRCARARDLEVVERHLLVGA